MRWRIFEKRRLGAATCLLALAACARLETDNAMSREALVERGRYLVTIADCAGCHGTGALAGRPKPGMSLAGADEGFDLPGLGVFYPPNLTPHATGLAGWSEDQIVASLRTGVRPDGRVLAPIMPWRAFANLTDEDAAAIAAYLKSVPSVDHPVPDPASRETAPKPYLALQGPGQPQAAAAE